MAKATIHARVYGSAANPKVVVVANIWDGNDVAAQIEFFDEPLVIFNCLGAIRVERMIDFLRALHPGIEIAVYLEENEAIGHVQNNFEIDVNRKLKEAA